LDTRGWARGFVAVAALGPLLLAAQANAATPAPVATAAGPVLATRIVGALAKMQSFRLEMTGPTGSGLAGVMTIEVPTKRLRLVMSGGTTVSESISADGNTYTRINGGPWTVHAIAADETSDPGIVQSMLDATRVHPLPDRTDDGRVVGVYEITLAPAVGAGQTSASTMTCTYDKATYLPRTCANGFVSDAFTNWNDSANAIVVPQVSATPRPR
jgi:hypothetical protein